jgi:hypothetical protein
MGVNGHLHAPAALCSGERTPGTHCTGGWVGPRAGLDTEVRGKILCPCRRSNLDRPVVQPVVRHYTDWATPAPHKRIQYDINITKSKTCTSWSTLTSNRDIHATSRSMLLNWCDPRSFLGQGHYCTNGNSGYQRWIPRRKKTTYLPRWVPR